MASTLYQFRSLPCSQVGIETLNLLKERQHLEVPGLWSEKPDIISVDRRREKLSNRCQLYHEKFGRSLAGTPVGSSICVPNIRMPRPPSPPLHSSFAQVTCLFGPEQISLFHLEIEHYCYLHIVTKTNLCKLTGLSALLK
ncbi:uncharacterized protein AAG666_017154 [Megaptera novaeangliae]